MQKQGSNSSHEGRKRIHTREESISIYSKLVSERTGEMREERWRRRMRKGNGKQVTTI